MIIIRLSSGIGNQLFQYSFAQYLKYKTGQDIYFDLNRFKFDKLRKLELNIIMDNHLIYSNKSLFSNYIGPLFRLKRYLFLINIKNKYITDQSLDKELTISHSKNYYFDGYWQTDNFINQLPNKKELFIPKEPTPTFIQNLLLNVKENQSISIHIRRGDYFSKQYIDRYGVCTAQYYVNAIKYIQGKINNPILYVFSDDLDWVKANIEVPDNTIFIPNENINSFWYIYLMSNCKHNIISNSTFSWWGAYLNANESKIVISPERWMLDSDKTIALNDWIKIKVK